MITFFCLLFMLVVGQGEQILYYLAFDDKGIQQVYQHPLNADEPRQITFADEDITHFGIAHDGSKVAYVSDGQLWLQSPDKAEALIEIEATEHLSNPVFSPDGQSIAYTDDGVWIIELETRETQQILVNVPVDVPDRHVSTIRLYTPQKFIDNTTLLVDIGIWEWQTVGIYDLATDTLQEFETGDEKNHTDLLVLSDGSVLLYGNNLLSGLPALHLAEGLDDLNTYTEIFDYGSLSLFVFEASEISPGVVRLFGLAIPPAYDGDFADIPLFTFDYDVETDSAGEVMLITEEMPETVLSGDMSADGEWMPFLFNPQPEENGEVYLLNLETGEITDEAFTEASSGFQWQP